MTKRVTGHAEVIGMSKRHPKIPADIDAELSPKARKFFGELIDDYERRIAELNQRIAVLEATVVRLEATVAKLESQLANQKKLTPKNSSIPPSTQHPHVKDNPKPKSKARNKRGGQPGHPRATRPLIPTEDCDKVEVLRPRKCRKCAAALILVGDYSGLIINCDRAKMYFDGKRLQWCWSHLKRDIQKLIDSSDKQVKRLGHDLMRQQRLLFEQWRFYKQNEIGWRAFRQSIAPVRKEFESLLLRGRFSGNASLIGICKELYSRKDWLWTFTKIEGIEPTNNAAERALRPAVIYRKLSFGTQSAAGSRFIERILTVSETCRQQKRSPYQYLIAAMEAHFAKKAPPSLLPKALDTAKKAA